MKENYEGKKLAYLLMTITIITSVVYVASLFTGLKNQNLALTLDMTLNQITIIYSVITSIATVSCISCYLSTGKKELFLTFLLFIVFVIDIMFGNIDRIYFDSGVFTVDSHILIPNSILRSVILMIMLFDKNKINNYIINNKMKTTLVVLLTSILIGVLEMFRFFDKSFLLDLNLIFYNSYVVFLYFSLSIKFFIKGLKQNEYIYWILSVSLLFFGLRWGLINYSLIYNSYYLELISMTLTLIGFITFIAGVVIEFLVTINKKKELQKELLIFKQVAEQSKNNCILIFKKNKKLSYANEYARVYLCQKIDIPICEVERILIEKGKRYVSKEVLKHVNSTVESFDFWSDSIYLREKDITLNASIQMLKFANEKSYVVMFKDVSQTVRQNKYLTEYESYIEQEKFRNEFFANISHELRTPLNIFYSTVQLLDKKMDCDDFNEVYKNHRKSLKLNSYRMLRLINNIVDISKMDTGFTKPCFVNIDIVRIVEEITLSILDYAKPKNINIVFDTQVEECVIKCDPNMIERIILNLLSNAIKFTNQNGNIFVDIFVNSEFVQIRIKDDGIGIPIDIQDKIFDRFVQSDKSLTRMNEGSGIGLSLVYSMVKLNDGEIYLESDGENGTEFEIILPNTITNNVQTKQDYVIEKYKIELELSDIYEIN